MILKSPTQCVNYLYNKDERMDYLNSIISKLLIHGWFFYSLLCIFNNFHSFMLTKLFIAGTYILCEVPLFVSRHLIICGYKNCQIYRLQLHHFICSALNLIIFMVYVFPIGFGLELNLLDTQLGFESYDFTI